MISKIIGFFLCILGILMPWRLRVLFSEVLGWITQFFYGSYYGILNFILKELKQAEKERNNKEMEKNHE